MKVDLSAALEALEAADFVKSNDYVTVRAVLHSDASSKEKERLTWDLYAYSADGKRSAWIMDGKTFDEALANLEKELQPSDRFVEEK